MNARMRSRLVEDRIEERICKIRVIDGVIANYYPQEELIHCKDCRHRPSFVEDGNGFRRYFFRMINARVSVMIGGTTGCQKTIGFVPMEKGKKNDTQSNYFVG